MFPEEERQAAECSRRTLPPPSGEERCDCGPAARTLDLINTTRVLIACGQCAHGQPRTDRERGSKFLLQEP
jgi:hypothetical protein